MLKIIFFLLPMLLNASMSDYQLCKKSLSHIEILDTKELNFPKKLKVSELSDLALDGDILYAVSDNGRVHQFSITLNNGHIENLQLLHSVKLLDTNAKRLSKGNRDSEGLFFLNNTLLISFEGNNRVVQYTLNGHIIKNLKLPKPLHQNSAYDGENRGLESVTYLKKYGIITAPERPLNAKKYHTIYAKNRKWKFHANGSITALEPISKNKLLILTRKFNHFTRRRITKLLQINLKKCTSGMCKVKELAKLDNYDGCRPDNFEGLTKVSKNRFLMVTDDNDSIFQKTLLVLFKIK